MGKISLGDEGLILSVLLSMKKATNINSALKDEGQICMMTPELMRSINLSRSKQRKKTKNLMPQHRLPHRLRSTPKTKKLHKSLKILPSLMKMNTKSNLQHQLSHQILNQQISKMKKANKRLKILLSLMKMNMKSNLQHQLSRQLRSLSKNQITRRRLEKSLSGESTHSLSTL